MGVQQAWDKQANFLSAQARAQKELGQLIHRYDELLHKNWELATEEQKIRIDVLRAKIENAEDEKTSVEDWKAAIIEIARKREEQNE